MVPLLPGRAQGTFAPLRSAPLHYAQSLTNVRTKDNLRRQRFEEIKRVVDAIGAQQTTAREQYLKFTGAYTIRYDVVHHTIRAYKGTTLNDIGPSIFTLPPDRIRERLYRATR